MTIILQESNHLYYAEVLTVKPWTLKPDRLSLFPPEEVAEGYTFEKVGQQYVLTDGTKVRLREVRNDGQVQLGGRNKKFDLIV